MAVPLEQRSSEPRTTWKQINIKFVESTVLLRRMCEHSGHSQKIRAQIGGFAFYRPKSRFLALFGEKCIKTEVSKIFRQKTMFGAKCSLKQLGVSRKCRASVE